MWAPAWLNHRRRSGSRAQGSVSQEGLVDRVGGLWDEVQSGRYRALPSRRVYIDKADGKQRPLGIAALEDKIVQQAVVAVLTPIYEAQFLGFSYGFRPGRSQHHALDALWIGLHRKRVNWVLDADTRTRASRHDSRQEPYAVVLHVRICAGGGG
jgi:Reverse transcriptase (RNA-dependent DNA polymerase)